MSLERNIERIADALEALVRLKPASFLAAPAATEEAAPAPAPKAEKKSAKPEAAAPAAAAPTDTAAKVTIEQLRAVGTQLISAGKAEKMKALLAEYKVEKLSALPETAYVDVLAKLQALAA